LLACSNQSWYENLQYNARQKCLEQPPEQAQTCLQQYQKSYQEYKKEREVFLQQANSTDSTPKDQMK
jgi:hypothetical protein